MHTEATRLTKADGRLRAMLLAADGGEVVRVLLKLRRSANAVVDMPTTTRFSSSTDRRRFLIRKQRDELRDVLDSTVATLETLGVHAIPNAVTLTLIADGRTEDIHRALALPVVESAYLDQPLEMIRPVSGSLVEPESK